MQGAEHLNPVLIMEKQTNVPKLRFPEFEEEWIEKKLGEIAEIVGGGTPDTSNEILWNGNIEWFTPTELKTKYVSKSIRKISTKGLKQSSAKILPVGTVLFSSRATVGDVSIALKECATNQGFQSFIVNKKHNNEFIYYWLSNNKNEFVKRASGSTFLEISKNEIIKIDVTIPSLPEQTKIASFLTAADDKLTQLKKKKSLLEEYKKGVMQKMFSQKLRFKDDNGNDFPEWEEKALGNIGDIVTGKTPNTKDLDLWNGEIQFVTPTDINENKYQFNTERTIKKLTKSKILPTKSIMFTCIASIGKMSLSINPCVTNQQINSVIPYIDYDNEFIYYSLLNIVDYIRSTQSANTLPIINKTEFSKFVISIPSLPEQTKIANFLSAIDEKISHCSKQIERMEEWKKGLLQQMFV